jgi:hypothetical protein
MGKMKCPHCSKVLRFGDEAAGFTCTCPACGYDVPIPVSWEAGGVSQASEVFDDTEFLVVPADDAHEGGESAGRARFRVLPARSPHAAARSRRRARARRGLLPLVPLVLAAVALFGIGYVLLSWYGTQQEAGAYMDACMRDSPAAYGSFLRNYPDGPHAQEALERLEKAHIRAIRAYATVPLCEQYLARFPDGRYADEARQKLADLRPRGAGRP